MDRPPRSFGTRAAVMLLVLAMLVPTTFFAAGLIVYLWTVQRDQVREQHEATVETLAQFVAEDLQDSIRRLEVLASSPLLASNDILGTAILARDTFLPRTPEWHNVVLVDAATGEQVFNLAASPGAALGNVGDRPHHRASLASGLPAVSDLFVGPLVGRPLVEIVVPVRQQRGVRYLLAAQLSLAHFGTMLQRQVKAHDVAIIVDSQRRILTRTRNAEEFIGRTPVPELDRMMQAAPSGWSRFIAFEGDAVYSAWTPVPQSPWSVAYGISAGPIERALGQTLALLGLAGAVLIGAAIAFAAYAVRRIGRAMELAQSAAELAAAGRVHPYAPTGIRELDALYRALQQAAKRVETEAEERTAVERAARQRVEAESRSKDEFLAMLGHELRNPLAAIANASHVLKLVPPGSREAASAVDVIARQTAQQKRLLDDLLDVARVSTGKLQLKREPMDLAHAVRHALASMEAAGRISGHRIVLKLEEAGLEADATRVEQIVANLLGNALKFTPPGGEIAITTGIEAGQAVLRVRDDGIGIDAAMLPRVFDLFAQDDPTPDRSAGGLGIGLTLVRRLAELHGGSVDAKSDGRGRGAEFVVRFPAAASAPPRAPLVATPASRAPCSILLVEDNRDVREMLASSLALDGHRLNAVGSGREALAAAGRAKPDVAVIDIGLPDMSGVEVARELRALHGHTTRLIALSGFGAVVAEPNLFDLRLVKPIAPDELAALVERLLEPEAKPADGR